MNTKQLTYPTIESQKQFWIDKDPPHFYGQFCECSECVGKTEAKSNNATPETREDWSLLIKQARTYAHCNCPDAPSYHSNCQRHLKPILDKINNEYLRLSLSDQSTTADPKPEDIGGNELSDRIQANEDYWSLRDEGRNPDGEGESYAARNV